MVDKAKSSSDILREEGSWPMTVGQVSEMTGVTRRALEHYDDIKLLSPARAGEGVANNRKLYMPEDIDRLKQIVVLGQYGFELEEMRPILDGEVNVVDALAEQLEILRAAENRLRNLILFARYAEIVGDDLFETLAFGTSQVDSFAEMLRDTPFFEGKEQRWKTLDEDGLRRMTFELGDLISDFLKADGDDAFADIAESVHRLRSWFREFFYEVDDLDLLNIWMLFEDGSEEAEFAAELGDESTPGFLQASVFLVWLKDMLVSIVDIANERSIDDAESLLRNENGVVQLIGLVCRSAGYPVQEVAELDADEWGEMIEFFETLMGYFVRALSDEDTVALIDAAGEIDLDADFFAKAAKAARGVKLFG